MNPVTSKNVQPIPGTYILIMQCHSSVRIQVGKWREIELQLGYYLYVGSAFGPGGVRARVSRHLRTGKSKHWHIDYLREHVTPLRVWVSYDSDRLEHILAQWLCEKEEVTSSEGFGCSDCQCYSHLFFSPKLPDFHSFPNITMLLCDL